MADSIRSALTEAYAEQETAATQPEVGAAPEVVTDAAVAGSPPTGGDVAGTATPSNKAPDATSASPSQTPAVKAGGKTDQTLGQPASSALQSPPAESAPGSWKAAEKAVWATIPPAAREAIKRRESEFRDHIRVAGEAKKHRDSYQAMLHPFEPLLQSKGIKDPMGEVIKPILQIRAALEIGSPEQKAALVANMVRDFKVDIASLDRALTSGIHNPPRPHAPPPPPFDPRSVPEFAPLYAMAERAQAQAVERTEAAIATVSALPHFEDVREDMADIIERFALNGRTVTTQEAYNRAVALNPELAPSVAPTSTVSTSEAAAILARSRKAASSISGAPKSSVGAKPTTLREQISAAMDG